MNLDEHLEAIRTLVRAQFEDSMAECREGLARAEREGRTYTMEHYREHLTWLEANKPAWA